MSDNEHESDFVKFFKHYRITMSYLAVVSTLSLILEIFK